MRHIDKKSKKKVISITIDEDILREARELGMNMSHNAEKAIAAEVKKTKEKRWKEENRPAIEAYNERIRREGLPIKAFWLEELEAMEDA